MCCRRNHVVRVKMSCLIPQIRVLQQGIAVVTPLNVGPGDLIATISLKVGGRLLLAGISKTVAPQLQVGDRWTRQSIRTNVEVWL
jgi:hypothetical protein